MVFSMSDPSGATLLHADVVTLAAMGCHALPVCAGIAIRDTLGQQGMYAFDVDCVADQVRTLLADIPVDVFKVGALPSSALVGLIAEVVSDYPEIPLVLDPVLELDTTSDSASEDEQLAFAIRELLVPQSTIVCVNSIDLIRLSNANPDSLLDDLDASTNHSSSPLTRLFGEPTDAQGVALHALLQSGPEYVLLTGLAQGADQLNNQLWGTEGLIRSKSWQRLSGQYRGAGDTLTAAIAAGMACELDISQAMEEAEEFVFRALSNGYRPGMGALIPDRLFWARSESDSDEKTPVEEEEPQSTGVAQSPGAHA